MLFNGVGQTVQTTLSEAVSECDPRAVSVLSQPLLIDGQHDSLSFPSLILLNDVHSVSIAIME